MSGVESGVERGVKEGIGFRRLIATYILYLLAPFISLWGYQSE